jgi:hypothetical protein
MKTNRFFLTALGFLTGMVSGVSIVGLLAFTNGAATPVPAAPIVPVTAAEAHGYFTNYISGATPLNQVVKGFTIDKAQLDAMNSISAENPGLTSFRIYFGKDSRASKVGIVVGVDDAGRDAINGRIYSTEAPKASPCPPICDTSSPIILDK